MSRLRRGCAAVFAILMVTTMFGPAVVTADTHQPRADDLRVEFVEEAQGANETPRERTAAALRLLRSLPEEGMEQQHAKEQAVAYVDGSRSEFRGQYHVASESVFHDHAAATRTLATFDRVAPGVSNETSVLLVRADRELATRSVRAADRAYDRTADELEIRGQRRKAEVAIRNAKRALEKAERDLDRAETGPLQARLNARAKAMKHYAQAWRHSQRALDVLDARTDPVLAIDRRTDPIRNGSQAVNRTITGTVYDVRPYELTNVTITTSTGRNVTVPLEPTTNLSTTRSFSVRLQFTERVMTVNVSVRDPDEDPAADRDREPRRGRQRAAGDGKKKGNGEEKHDAEDEGRSGADDAFDGDRETIMYDGDGLSDRYERTVVGTDPLDPDSNASRTAVDESDNGIVDGAEDFDDDGLPTLREFAYGTDPFLNDTDGDGLNDFVEQLFTQLNATKADTDGDGVEDGAADPDGDGLTTAQEVENGTAPFRADTDDDGLSDPRELELGTETGQPDSDDDGLLDGEEIALGTDPLDPDTDDDGVLDGNETFTTTAESDAFNASVELTGQGDLASSVTFENGSDPVVTSDAVDEAAASRIVDIESTESFERANVTLSYDAAAVENDSTLAMFWFDEEMGTYRPLNSTVDPANGTVTATTTHFTRFVVFRVPTWSDNFETETAENVSDDAPATTKPVDTAFVIDSSGSMQWNDPRGFRKVAAKRFVGALLDIDRAAVVDFDFGARVTQGLTTDFAAVNASIDRLDARGGTNIGAGVRTANGLFASQSNDSRSKVAILLTDGRGGGGIGAAETAADRNITIYTVGFGAPNKDKLRRIANITGGQFYFVESASDLPDVFSRVAENTTSRGLDSDGDGIPNRVEREFTTGTGETLSTDPFDNDTDNDGLSDGQEIGERVNETEVVRTGPDGELTLEVTRSYRRLNSNPLEVDSDDDGLSDYFETEVGWQVSYIDSADRARQFASTQDNATRRSLLENRTVTPDPMSANSDSDEWNDSEEFRQRTDPTSADTDADGLRDHEERGEGELPTIHDYRPPKVTVIAVSAELYVADLERYLREALEAAGEFAAAALRELGNLLTFKQSEIADWTVSQLESIRDWSAKKLGEFSRITLNKLEALGEWSAEKLDELAAMEFQDFVALTEWSVDKLGELADLSLRKVQEITSWGVDRIQAVGEYGLEKFQELVGLGYEKLVEIGSWGVDKVEELGTWGADKIGALADWTVDGLSNLGSKAAGKIGDLGGKAVDKISQGWDSVTDFFDDIFPLEADATTANASNGTAVTVGTENGSTTGTVTESTNDSNETTITVGDVDANESTTAESTSENESNETTITVGSVNTESDDESASANGSTATTADGNASANLVAEPDPGGGGGGGGGDTAPLTEGTAAEDDDVPDTGIDPFASKYVVRYYVQDPSGVGAAVVKKNGVTERMEFDGRTATPTVTQDIFLPSATTGAIEAALTGESIKIQAFDVHGNNGTTSHFESNFYAEAAYWVEQITDGTFIELVPGISATQTLALLSGFTYGVGKSLEGILSILTDPVGELRRVLEGFVQLAAAIWEDYTIIGELIGQGIQSFRQSQWQQNPFASVGLGTVEDIFTEGASAAERLYNNVTFAAGWYGGYGLSLVFSAVLGDKGVSKVTTFLRANSRIARTVLDKVGGLRKAFRGTVTGPAKSWTLRSIQRVARSDYTPDVFERVFDGLSYAAQRVTTKLMVQQLDPDTRRIVRGADGGEPLEEEAVRFMNLHGRRGADVLDDLDDRESIESVVSWTCGGLRRPSLGATASTTAGDSRCTLEADDEMLQETVDDAAASPDVDADEVTSKLDGFDDREQELIGRAVGRSDGAGEFVDDVDTETLERITNFRADSLPDVDIYDDYRRGLVDRYAKTGDADEIETVVRRVDAFDAAEPADRTALIRALGTGDTKDSTFRLLADGSPEARDWVADQDNTELALDAWKKASRDRDDVGDVDADDLDNALDTIKNDRSYDELEFDRNTDLSPETQRTYDEVRADLDSSQRAKVDEIVDEVGPAGKRFLVQLRRNDPGGDGDLVERFLEFEHPNEGTLRKAIVESYKQEHFDGDAGAKFVRGISDMQDNDVDNLDELLEDDIVKQYDNLRSDNLNDRTAARNNIVGGEFEAIVDGDRIGANNLDAVNVEPADGETLIDDIEASEGIDDLSASDIDLSADGISVKQVTDDTMIVEVEVYDADEGAFVARDVQVNMNYEFDALSNDGDVFEMKAGDVEKEQTIQKLVRTKLYQQYVGGDGDFKLYVNDGDDISGPTLKTIEKYTTDKSDDVIAGKSRDPDDYDGTDETTYVNDFDGSTDSSAVIASIEMSRPTGMIPGGTWSVAGA